MKVTIDITGGRYTAPSRKLIDRNISAIERALKRGVQGSDVAPLIDTQSILRAIREQLPE